MIRGGWYGCPMRTGGGTRLLAVGILAALVLGAGDAVAAERRAGRRTATPAGTAACDAGWGAATVVGRTHITDVHTAGPHRAIAVGIGRRNATKRLPVWSRWDGSTWTTEWAARGGGGLLALAAEDGGPVWAVGYRSRSLGSSAGARRLTDAGWEVSDPPSPRTGSETLADVSLAPVPSDPADAEASEAP